MLEHAAVVRVGCPVLTVRRCPHDRVGGGGIAAGVQLPTDCDDPASVCATPVNSAWMYFGFVGESAVATRVHVLPSWLHQIAPPLSFKLLVTSRVDPTAR